MVAYLDSSVLLKHILNGGEEISQVFECDSVVSSELLEIECRRVIHRYRLEKYLDDSGYITAIDRLEKILIGVSLLSMTEEIKKRASQAFPVIIKTLDALHLASALIFQSVWSEETLFVFSFDRGLNRCARAMGLAVPFGRGDV